MKLAALYSGGKDSTFSIFRSREMGHTVECLVTIHPAADDSALFHYPNSWITGYLAETMQIPLLGFPARGKTREREVEALTEAIAQARSLYGIEGIVYGGISSKFQKEAFEETCEKQNLEPVAPLWGAEPVTYVRELLDQNFQIMIVGVSAMGLEKEWLGMTLDGNLVKKLESLSYKYGFNLTFEGGEAETLVTDCPLFAKKVHVKDARIRWDGQRGIFEILEVELVSK